MKPIGNRQKPVMLSPASYDEVRDAVRRSRAHQLSPDALDPWPAPPGSGIVFLRNDSGALVDRFGVLGIDAPLVLPNENFDGFAARMAIAGVLPSGLHAGRFAIALEPIDVGRVGRAVVSGAVPCSVRMLSESHRAADVDPGSAARLLSGSGAASLLWVQPAGQRTVADIAVCLVNFGGGAPPGQTIVKVKKDGGVAGDSTTQCTFTYMIFAESETVYDAAHTLKNADGSDAVLLTPVQRRSPVGAYLQPADGTLGEARFNAATGLWQLMTVYREVLDTGGCGSGG